MNVKRNTAFDKLLEEKGGLPAASQDEHGEDSWEEPSGDGRSSRHQVFSLMLVNGKKEMVAVPYSSIVWGEGPFNGRSFRFEFVRGEELWEAVIEGNLDLQRVVDKIAGGKRECVRCNGETVTKVTWAKLG